jgi:hypothetical protein
VRSADAAHREIRDPRIDMRDQMQPALKAAAIALEWLRFMRGAGMAGIIKATIAFVLSNYSLSFLVIGILFSSARSSGRKRH